MHTVEAAAAVAALALGVIISRRRRQRRDSSAQNAFSIVRMQTDDADAKAFVMEGYLDIQRTEGNKVSANELAFVQSGLDALRSTSDDGILLCLCEGRMVGFLWHVRAEACQFGPGCYYGEAPYT